MNTSHAYFRQALAVGLALLLTTVRGEEPVTQAFYGVLVGVTTEEELRANPRWGQPEPLKIALSPETMNVLENRFGIWRRILVAISPDHRVRPIEVTPPERTRAETWSFRC
jgi:hypothetical protein